MATGSFKRLRTDRVSGFVLPPGQLARALESLRRGDVMLRIGLCALTALFLWLVTAGWAPPFAYRPGYIPPRDIVSRVKFELVDPIATQERDRKVRSETLAIYENDKKPLLQLQQQLKENIFKLLQAETFDKVNMPLWREFYVPAAPGDLPAEKAGDMPVGMTEEEAFSRLRAALAEDMDLDQLDSAIKRAMSSYERDGLLDELQHERNQADMSALLVHPLGSDQPASEHRVLVDDVRIAAVPRVLEQRLYTELRASGLPADKVDVVGKLVFHWLKSRLPKTLNYLPDATKAAVDLRLLRLDPVMKTFSPGIDELAPAGRPLGDEQLKLLAEEHSALVASMTAWQRINYTLAILGMYASMFTLCGAYLYHNARPLLTNLRRFTTLLGMVVVTIVLCCLADDWRVEIVPLLLFGMTLAIAYERELALLISSCVALVFTITAGFSLYEFIILSVAVTAAILLIGRIRSRTKLIYIGAFTGAVAMLTAIGVGTLAGQAFGASGLPSPGVFNQTESLIFGTASFATLLMVGAAWLGFCGLLSGLLMTGLLPFIERLFDIQTDISLLELGDVAHPLLQELVRRAPGTYNHSINVASIADAAAEAIGANGLLVRVGAYFHDIGKMLKPGYFVENQGTDPNRHETLMPAMSTLVIIAHVKDGADLARQHHLPRTIIDFIEQHHGTTLVEFFYRQAAKQSSANPDGSPVDESSFRYPGPKPQTKEAAVLMLADACESASRALVDPTPARLESLVHDIALKRLLDGQFEECGLSLQELHTIEDSLVKSLTAVYHGRVKYPSQQTA
jgi:putative nucleotidyltransferase with HDIG domain